ncbi:MAG: hydroxymethylbilane synthase, partial [Oscillospiraceae bacterium]|nr:hydroxymethylbilane synthase [Oscillospiraceae bacterium]
ITTKGDRVLDRPLEAIGGKGVYIAEIEEALLHGVIDLAIHSAKDLPSSLAEGTVIGAVLERGDAREVLIARKGGVLTENSVIGTGSERRRTQFTGSVHHAVFKDIRGNVDTRLDKLAEGQYDGVILAKAGLERLGLDKDDRFDFRIFSPDDFIPAACQGIIAVQSRYGDLEEILRNVDNHDTHICFNAEREILKLENSDCSSPLGAYSFIENGILKVTAARGRNRGYAEGEKSEWHEFAYKAWSRV